MCIGIDKLLEIVIRLQLVAKRLNSDIFLQQ
jgi:hypothetical protein